MNHRIAGMRRKLHGLQGTECSRRDNVRIRRFACRALREKESKLRASETGGVGDGVGNRGVDDTAIENAVASASDGLAIAGYILCEPEARTEIFAV